MLILYDMLILNLPCLNLGTSAKKLGSGGTQGSLPLTPFIPVNSKLKPRICVGSQIGSGKEVTRIFCSILLLSIEVKTILQTAKIPSNKSF